VTFSPIRLVSIQCFAFVREQAVIRFGKRLITLFPSSFLLFTFRTTSLLDQRLAEHHRRADRRFYFGRVLSMAARSSSEYDWAFPRRFHRRGGSAIFLLKKIKIQDFSRFNCQRILGAP
jgi:hypothetical protein